MERTYYPDYSVLSQQDEWDEHTRQIVCSRMGPFSPPKNLTDDQAAILRALFRLLVVEEREEMLAYMINYFDTKLSSPIGEAQRTKGVPPFPQLLINGLAGLDGSSHHDYGHSFIAAERDQQMRIVQDVERGQAKPASSWLRVPQREFFNRLLAETVSAYYSHPVIWSEIGYAGPAYPRGYMRVELGLTEPWEAKQHGE